MIRAAAALQAAALADSRRSIGENSVVEQELLLHQGSVVLKGFCMLAFFLLANFGLLPPADMKDTVQVAEHVFPYSMLQKHRTCSSIFHATEHVLPYSMLQKHRTCFSIFHAAKAQNMFFHNPISL